MEVYNQQQDVTICPLCSSTFIDPKILPCIHTFCLKCLESIASRAGLIPGGNMLCPVCSKRFTIPKEGLAKLQKNCFIERLLTLRGVLNTNGKVCDACIEDVDEPLSIQTASASSYCFNCSMKLCDDCCKLHRKSKLTENHKLVETTNQKISVQLMEMFVPSHLCEQHINEQLKLYCTDCSHFVCTSCFMEKHQGHTYTDAKVYLAAHDYRSQLRLGIDEISTCATQIQRKHSQLEQGKTAIVKHIRSLKDEIEKSRLDLRGIVDGHAYSLMAKLGSLETEELKDIETKKENINRHRICLEGYQSYTNELTEKATDTDIHQTFEFLTARALELREMSAEITRQLHPPFHAAFRKTNLDAFIGDEFMILETSNIVGTVQVNECEKPKEISTERNTGTISDSLLKQRSKIEQLTQELEFERSNRQNHEAKIKEISQELNREKASKSSLQELVDKLKQDLHVTRETALSRQHRERPQQNLQSEQLRLRELTHCNAALSSKVLELEKMQKDQRQEWTVKDKLLRNEVTKLQLDLAVATQATVKVQKELEDERKEKIVLNSKITQCLQHESQYIREKNEFATKEKHLKELTQRLTYQEDEIQKLKQEVVSERAICNSLKAEKLELQEQHKILQEEVQSVHTKRDSQDNLIRSVKALLEKEKTRRTAAEDKLRNATLQIEQVEQQKLLALKELKTAKENIQRLEERRKERLRESNRVITSERENFKKRQTELSKLLFTSRPENTNYKDVKATKPFISSLVGKRITGLTIVDDTLYVTTEKSQLIETYQFHDTETFPTFSSKQNFSVTYLSDPMDITGTKRDCMYVFDQKCQGKRNEILKLDLNLKIMQKWWSVGDDDGSLSITDEANVILTVHNKSKLKEYTSDGQMIREITLSCNPLHSLKLSSGHFLVSFYHSYRKYLAAESGVVCPSSGICIVDETGEMLRTFEQESKSWLEELHRPVCLAIDNSGCILVADESSGRVLCLTPTLEFKGEMVSRRNGLCHPTRIHLDESNGSRLIVVDKDQIHVVKFNKETIQQLEERLSNCDTAITSERDIFKKRQNDLLKLLFKGRPEKTDYRDVKVSTPSVSSLVGKLITGVTIVDDRLYVTTEHSQVIKIFSCHFDNDILPRIASLIEVPVPGLTNPRDIKFSKRNCLFIFDKKSGENPNEIVRIDIPLGLGLRAVKRRWSVDDDDGSLSITDEGNVIFTIYDKNKLKEYTSDGQMIREITLSSDLSGPLHSLKLSSGLFVVSFCQSTGLHLAAEHGEVSPSSGICIVDENGEILKTFGEENKAWLKALYRPVCLAIDNSGCILVADDARCRVLLLSPTLEFKSELVSIRNGLRHPTMVHLDESNSPRLFVVDKDQICVVMFTPHPISKMQSLMEWTVKSLGSILTLIAVEGEWHEDFLRALQSQGTLYTVRACEGLVFLFLIVAGISFLSFLGWCLR